MTTLGSDGWVRVFEVIEPTKHRKGFTVYKVISRVFHKNSIEGITELVTYKRFSEFKKLHKSLSALHVSLHLKGIIPSFPDSTLFGRFDEQVIETRRQSALALLEFAATHPPLFTSNVFVKFFENSTTNFTTVSLQEVIDSPTDDTNHLPQPLQPLQSLQSLEHNLSLSPSDNCSTRSDLSDVSSYYSTPIHSLENLENNQNSTQSKTQLSQFDPLVNNDNSFCSLSESAVKQSNNWFIYAIQSCDGEGQDSSQIKIATIDNEDNTLFPKPFSDIKSNETNSKEDLNVNYLSVSNEIDCSALELKPNDNQNGNSLAFNENISSLNISEDIPNEKCNEDINKTDELNETYLLDAATLIAQGQQHEESLEYEAAFESYKCAVGILLQGVSNETDSEKKASIRRKTFQYLTRAEQIYDTYLNESQPFRRWAPDSPFKTFTSSFISSWFGSGHELTKFKVIGIVSKVQIVIDTTTNNIFVIKVIYKTNIIENSTNSSTTSSSNALSSPQSIFPHDIPHMVQIYRIFKTEYALFLLLEFAKGGKLWEKISSNSQTSLLSPCPDCTFVYDDNDDYLIVNNAYSGRRLSRAKSESAANAFVDNNYSEEQLFTKSDAPKLCSPSGSLASIESIDCDIPSKSYLSLCNNYAFSRQNSEQSCLANCKLGSISDSINSIDSITDCDSKIHIPSEKSNKIRSLSQSKRQLSVESLGISGLLAKARGILKNVDETLRATKYLAKHETQNTDRINLRESKSEMSLSLMKSRRISEVFHQLDANANSLVNRPHVTEEKAKVWLSQIIRCLKHLHKFGIIYCDLKPENLLLSENENVLISYKCLWNQRIDENARERLFVAQELNKSESSDWWSVGVIAYELLTSRPLVSYYPNGITSHTLLYFPDFLSLEAKDLLNNLLQPNPSERLSIEEILTHPFFEGISWE